MGSRPNDEPWLLLPAPHWAALSSRRAARAAEKLESKAREQI